MNCSINIVVRVLDRNRVVIFSIEGKEREEKRGKQIMSRNKLAVVVININHIHVLT